MIPKNAKRVFHGKVFEVFQWEQKMYDGSTSIFESLKRPDTVEVIATVGDKIMLQEQFQPDSEQMFLCLPGGRLELEEDPLSGGKREMLEETGYASEAWELLRSRRPSGKIIWSVHVYIAHQCKKITEQNLDSGEKIALRLVSFEELLDLVDSGKLQRLETETRIDFIRAKYDVALREQLRKKLFPQF